MKRFSLIVVGLVAASSLSFGQLKQGGMAITTSIGPGTAIGGSYALSENMRLNVGLEFQSMSRPAPLASITTFGVGAGVWMYSAAMENVTMFYGGNFSYGSTGPSGATSSTLSVAVDLGAEYWFSSRFSWGGYVSAGFASSGPSGATTSTFGTMGVSTSLSWWFN